MMTRPLEHLFEALALSANQRQELTKDLDSINPRTTALFQERHAKQYSSSESVSAACAVAKKAFGSSVVNEPPLNSTEVDENW